VINEVIVTTRSDNGGAQIAPMGIKWREDIAVIAPFRPSRTLNNLLARGCAAINYTDDVRIFAGCLSGRYEWPLSESQSIDAPRLTDALAHTEVRLEHIEEDELRPRLLCRTVFEANHAPFRGFNRAQAAVLELAILTSRLGRLPMEKIEREIDYLGIAMDKTAGQREKEAWCWLMEKIDRHRLSPESVR
jgi:hypothetical protein